MAEFLYNQGGVTIDTNGVRRYADGSSDTVSQSMLSGLTNPAMGSGSLSGINFNGGLSPTLPELRATPATHSALVMGHKTQAQAMASHFLLKRQQQTLGKPTPNRNQRAG
jgi:hypothetical protein